MKTIFLDNHTSLSNPCAATIGFFDGVHRGHQYLIRKMADEARRRGLETMVITFDHHPRQVLNADYQPMLLNTLDEKLALLEKTGIDKCVVLPFDNGMASMPAKAFMHDVLKDKLNVRLLIMGYDNRFGHSRSESFDDYVEYGKELQIEVARNDAFGIGEINVSSSMTRALLQEGEAEMAARCLGYSYMISGEVVHGSHVGTGIGFPTANIKVGNACKLIPANGVYAVRVWLPDVNGSVAGMMNIGTCPTFDGAERKIEVHIFNHQSDLYGKQIAVSFIKKIRQEKKFRSVNELTKQLNHDADEARNILGL